MMSQNLFISPHPLFLGVKRRNCRESLKGWGFLQKKKVKRKNALKPQEKKALERGKMLPSRTKKKEEEMLPNQRKREDNSLLPFLAILSVAHLRVQPQAEILIQTVISPGKIVPNIVLSFFFLKKKKVYSL